MQKLAEGAIMRCVFDSIGMYLAHTLSLYEMFYDIGICVLLGRVASGIAASASCPNASVY